MARTFGVTVPIAGHAYIEVEADNAEDAINKEVPQVRDINHLQ